MTVTFSLTLVALLSTCAAVAQPGGGMEFSIGAATDRGAGGSGAAALRYDFTQGESVTYRVLSYDSLMIWAEEPKILIRHRVERITYRCDTILPDGFGMTMTLNDVIVREKFDTLPWVTRTVHPWSGQSIRFLMAPDGMRLRLRDTLSAPGVMPGAPFQPLLLPHFGGTDSVGYDVSSVFDREMWLLENAYPPVLWKGAVMRKYLGGRDTLGQETVAIQLNETGQLWYMPPTLEDGRTPLSIHTRLNGACDYLFAPDLGYPVAGSGYVIGDLTFGSPDETDDPMQGRQIISMEFAVDQLSTDLMDVFDTEETE
jgi:hypothetical protein